MYGAAHPADCRANDSEEHYERSDGQSCGRHLGALADCATGLHWIVADNGRCRARWLGMYAGLSIGAVIPAHNEEDNIGAVVRALRAVSEPQGKPAIDEIVVCDNASSDATAERAVVAGARVVEQPQPGYGIACQTAIAALPAVDVVLFVDGDQAFDVRQCVDLLAAIADGADVVIGSRVLGTVEPGAMSPPQVLGNRVAAVLIRLLWGRRITDLGPFRAVRADALRRLDMRDTAYGWTVEMQVKAIQHGMNMVECPVDTRRRRFGKSKVGGTVRGVVGASVGILSTILRLRCCGKGPG